MASAGDSSSSSVSNGHASTSPVDTELLIIGTGPAGASLACFLASHGLRGIMLSSAPTTSDTPRAHITNMAALECMRDIGLEEECIAQATKGDCMMHTRWCRDMTGEEFGRIYSWGNDPYRKGDYETASPCDHVDLPQTVFEPIIVRYATLNGWTTRFNTSFLSFDRDKESGTITSKVRDDLSKHTYTIRSKYLFGCDGARSQVLRELDIPLIRKPGQGLAINVLVRVDLSDYIEDRKGNLHWVFNPEEEYPDYAWCAVARMVKPWNEWMFIFFPLPWKTYTEPTRAQWTSRCREIVGPAGAHLPLEVLDVSKWQINDIIASSYSLPTHPNIFCLGDAVHRHPPLNGLGSNTCVQDAFNLAWKVAYVTKGHARSSLLDSYTAERQPVGLSVVTRANQGVRDHGPVWAALGVTPDLSKSDRDTAFGELSLATPAGARRRAALREAIKGTSHEFHGLGIEMGQRYVSNGIYVADEESAERKPPATPDDEVLEFRLSTYPGSRLPHAWLNTRVPGRQFSTIDLAGHGCFCVLTGIGGEKWKDAASVIGKELGIEVRAYSLGWLQDYEDVYGEWADRREIDEDGMLLVRPDRFIAWRSMDMVDDPLAKLGIVMKKVLGRDS